MLKIKCSFKHGEVNEKTEEFLLIGIDFVRQKYGYGPNNDLAGRSTLLEYEGRQDEMHDWAEVDCSYVVSMEYEMSSKLLFLQTFKIRSIERIFVPFQEKRKKWKKASFNLLLKTELSAILLAV